MSDAHAYDALIAQVRKDLALGKLPDIETAKARLTDLRNFREFVLIIRLAECCLSTWPDEPLLRKLYGQALIDNDQPHAGLAVVRDALTGGLERDHAEYADILGVTGRAHKDLFLRAHGLGLESLAANHAQSAFDAYHSAYVMARDDNTYQGINAAAVIARCKDEDVPLTGAPACADLAKEIIATLSGQPAKQAWIPATLAEAQIPLRRWDDMEDHLAEYLACDPTPFQIMGTARQFRDVWQLGSQGGRGGQVLALLDAAALKKSDGFGTTTVPIPPSGAEAVSDHALEKILGADGLQTYDWLLQGFERAQSVAAVLNQARRRMGTAFVIEPANFGFGTVKNTLFLMTNYHVLNRGGIEGALSLSSHPRLRFEANDALSGEVLTIRDILFESPFGGEGLDCTIFTVQCDAAAPNPIPLEPDILPDIDSDPTPRVYIIGHPQGGEMQFSLQDNRLLDHEGPDAGQPPVPLRQRIHYFAPTQPGSSGSPVFDSWWNCIALHHAGLKHDPDGGVVGMARLNGKSGHHSANEGISIASIVAAVKATNDYSTD